MIMKPYWIQHVITGLMFISIILYVTYRSSEIQDKTLQVGVLIELSRGLPDDLGRALADADIEANRYRLLEIVTTPTGVLQVAPVADKELPSTELHIELAAYIHGPEIERFLVDFANSYNERMHERTKGTRGD